MRNNRVLAGIAIVALIVVGVLVFQESRESDAEKLGESIEEAAEDVKDAVDND